MSFSAAPVPCHLLCLASLVAAQALCDGAFKTRFESFEALLQQPNLENTNHLELKWKDDFAERYIFPISYTRFRTLWHRTLQVAGLRERIRPYAMRVGAGSRFAGVLTLALRSYIQGNSESVFRHSYQPTHVGDNLIRLGFGRRAGQGNEESDKLLFELL